MLRSSSLAVRTLASRVQGRRTMAGGFPSNLKVKKNKFVEEWNGKREITEKTFEVDQSKVPTIFITLILIPAGMYYWFKAEFQARGDHRYKEMV